MTIEDSFENWQLTIPWTIDNFFDRMRGILGNLRIFHGWVSSFTFASTRKAFASFTKKKMMFSWKHSHSYPGHGLQKVFDVLKLRKIFLEIYLFDLAVWFSCLIYLFDLFVWFSFLTYLFDSPDDCFNSLDFDVLFAISKQTEDNNLDSDLS